jgi:hypothetical protein
MDTKQAVRFGGNSCTHRKCGKCNQVKPLEEFLLSHSRCTYCLRGKTRADIDDAKRCKEQRRQALAHKSNVCYICNREQPLSEFQIQHKLGRDVVIGRCKQCRKEFIDVLIGATQSMCSSADSCGVDPLVVRGARTERQQREHELYLQWCKKLLQP